jgi:hypothetical protein
MINGSHAMVPRNRGHIIPASRDATTHIGDGVMCDLKWAHIGDGGIGDPNPRRRWPIGLFHQQVLDLGGRVP